MKKPDPAFEVPHVRLIAAVYFALLAVIATILIDVALYALGVEEILPVFKLIILSAATAGIFGWLFGEKIMHCKRPYQLRSFVWGFVMVLAALPFFNIGLIAWMSQHHADLFASATLTHYLALFVISLLYTFILAGLWLAFAAGFAAMYLRGHLIYDIFRSNRITARQKYDLSDFDYHLHHPAKVKHR